MKERERSLFLIDNEREPWFLFFLFSFLRRVPSLPWFLLGIYKVKRQAKYEKPINIFSLL